MSAWIGVVRSLILYWRPGRQRGLRRLYAPLVGPGDLVFDIGAHVGDRSAAFADLGARVVALEPQPQLLPWLRRLAARRNRITVRPQAIGSEAGKAQLSISSRTPTVSTLATRWREELPDANPGFRSVRWDRIHEVRVTTLDELITEFGVPKFCKLDVEGSELEALAGLSHPIGAVSVEFIRGGLDLAAACVARLEELGRYEYNVVGGEGRVFHFRSWVSPERVAEWLDNGAGGFRCGDVYARLREVGDG